jgi:hypothetical protein
MTAEDDQLRALAREMGLPDDDPDVLRDLRTLQQSRRGEAVQQQAPGWRPDPDEQKPGPTKSDWQLGIGLGFAGAAVLLISAFLPMAESTEFAKVVDNTMIQTGAEGWGVVVLALAGAGATYRRTNGEGNAWPLIVVGILGVGLAFYIANSDALTLKSAAPTKGMGLGEALRTMSHTEKASPGIGIYALGLGGLLTLIAGYLLRTAK